MKFKSVSIVLPTLKETTSFITAIQMILDMNNTSDIEEFIAVVCEKTTEESLSCIEEGKEIAKTSGIPLRILWQAHPYFGGAVYDGFMAAKGSHVCMVTPDLDTAPDKLPDMINLAKKYPGDIISGSRWLKGGGFLRYNKIKKAWNWCSQQFLRVLYLSAITDFTWGNHLAPTILYQTLNFQEFKHPINVEKVVIPLRLGIRFHEVAAVCCMPEEDQTVNPFWANLEYLRPAIRWRFASKKRMLKESIDFNELVKQLQNDERG